MKKYIFFLKFLFCNYFLLLSQNNKKSLLQNDCIDKIDTLYYLVDSINLRVTFNDKKFYLNHLENGFVTKKNEIKLSFEESFFFEENNLGCIELKIKQFPYYKFHGISEEYYLNGIQYSESEWKERVKGRDGLPWYKGSGAKARF